jgi:hypothetical protein
MCDPITIGLALTAGSTVANSIGASQAARARDDALAAEQYRQKQLSDQAAAANTAAQDRYNDFDTKQADSSAKLGDYFKNAPDSANTAVDTANTSAASVMPTATNDIVTREISKQNSKAKDFTDQQGMALGDLRSFGDVMGTLSRGTARDAGTIGQIASFKQGSSNVLPYELEAANSKGSGWRTLGDILGAAGSMYTGKGISANALAAPVGTSPWSLITGNFSSAPSIATTAAGTATMPVGYATSSLGSYY